jgi:FtsP/CotA-like multicopper oxidase with cupredoxin domain/sugar lactone lactonase YvrE
MNLQTFSRGAIGVAGVLIIGLSVSPVNAARPYPKVTNVSPNPAGTNEFYLTATNMTVTNIGGTNVQVRVYMDDPPGGGGAPAGLPCPMIEVNVGTKIICHFKNKLTNNMEGASIHWHGIELNNDSDGTAITQDSILPGQTYVYQFIAPRPGLYWYHSHMIPGTSTFDGMYGPIIVTSNIETTLMAEKILPPTNYTFPLVLSDISFTNGVPGKVVNGTNYALNSLIIACENYVIGGVGIDFSNCGPAGLPGDVVLVNGYPPALAGSFSKPTTKSTPIYKVANKQRIRLQLFCQSISRDFYLSLHYPNGDTTGDTNLYRIGGQGGLLDNAILDGGMQGDYDFNYNKGSIVLGSGMRADVMFYPSGANGDVVELVGNPLPAPWNLSKSGTSANITANYPIAFFVIDNTGTTNDPITNGSPILAGTSSTNESLKTRQLSTLIPPPAASEGVTPAPFGGDFITPSDNIVPLGTIVFENGVAANGANGGPNMNGYAATALDGNSGDGSWPGVPHPPSALWARVGDVLQLTVINDVIGGDDNDGSVHPFHLHGFSMQPMYIYSADLGTKLYTFNYNEFLDTIEIYPGQALVFRIHLTDRPKFAATATGGPYVDGVTAPSGGAAGRWLMHCHIFMHGTVGMISELDVVSNTLNRVEGPAAGSDSAILWGSAGAWTATTSAPWLHLSAANQSGTGSTNVIFTYDANTGATRTGTLDLAGETVNVTQAGSTYVQAPGPVTTLASTAGYAEDVAVDADGNVYFCDAGSDSIKKWTASDNTVTTLIPGLSDPQGVAVDSLGNLYFTQSGTNAVEEWSASSHALTTVPFTGLFFPGLSQPEGVAVDAAGNVYVADIGNDAVYEWVAFENIPQTLATGLSEPYGVAVDVAGNVYIADTFAGEILELQAANGELVPLVSSGLSNPWNVAVDGAGNVYIADTYDDAIKEWSVATKTLTTLVSGLSFPDGVAVDGSQNVYIADYGNEAVKELPYAFVDTSDIVVNGTAATHDVPVVVPATANLAAPFASSNDDFSWVTITGGGNGLVDFAITANGGDTRLSTITVLGETIGLVQDGPSFTLGANALLQGPAAGSNSVVLSVVPDIGTWSAGSFVSWMHLSTSNTSGTGSTNVVFSLDANTGATRSGDINIGNLSSSVLLSVTQAGSTYVQAPGPVTALVKTGLDEPEGLAVDGAGNVYFSDSKHHAIKKWTLANNTVTNLATIGTSVPQGVAVDGAGNVYFADFSAGSIREWLVADRTDTKLITGLVHPTGVAVDGSSNVYIADPGAGLIEEWTAANGHLTTLVSSADISAYGVAVDAAGNVYIADTYGNAIREWIAENQTLITLVSSNATTPLHHPWNVAVDGAGNVYIADGDDGAIKEWVAANETLITLVSSGLDDPTGVAVDGSRNVYIADFKHNAIKELPYAFVDPTAKTEGKAAGSDVLPVVLFDSENLLAPFAPTVNKSWLRIGSNANGVVTFDFTANATTASRTGDIKLLGQTIPITQAGVMPPPKFIDAKIRIDAKIVSKDVFQFGFSNANPDASFSILFSTNLEVPLTNWVVIGTASNISPGVLQFTDTNASDSARFYMIRSP